MAHSRRGARELPHTLQDFPVRAGGPLVLAEMFRPGIDVECLDEAMEVLQVAEDAPLIRAIAPANSLKPPHGLEKGLLVLRLHLVLDRDQDRAGLR